MTISSEERKAGPYPGNSVAATFPFGFKIFKDTDLLVVLTIDGAEQELVFGDDYAVNLNPNQEDSPGGEVVLNAPLADGHLLTMTSAVQNLQPTSITNQGAFYPAVVNQALDRLTILVQQVAERVGRSVKVPISSSVTPDALIAQLTSDAASAREAAQNASQTSVEINEAINTAQLEIDQKVAEAAKSAADAENRVPMTGSTGYGLLPEGNDDQAGAVPSAGGAIRFNTQDPADYKLTYWDRVAKTVRTIASRAWVKAITDALEAAKPEYAFIYPNGGTAAAPANVVNDWRGVFNNPWPGHHITATVFLYTNGRWTESGWDGGTGAAVASNGAKAGYDATNDKVVIQTGINAVDTRSNVIGSMSGIGAEGATAAPCYILVEKKGKRNV